MAKMRIQVSDAQLDGGIDYEKYKRCVGAVGTMSRDMDTFKLWMAEADNSFDLHGVEPVFELFEDAFVGMERLSEAIAGGMSLDTRNPGLWLVLRDALCGCNRLALLPDARYRDDKTALDMFRSTAFILDATCRLTDVASRREAMHELFGDLDDRYVLKRALPIMLDVVVGRGAAWIAFIDHMGSKAALEGGSGTSWIVMRNRYAAGRGEVFLDKLAKRLGCEPVEALDTFKDRVNRIAVCHDAWQVLSLKTSLGIRLDTLNRGRRFEPAGCMDGFFEDDEALDMVGYARMFGVSAVAATSCVPVNIEVEVRKGRIAKLREEARKEAEERKRRISDFINGGKY